MSRWDEDAHYDRPRRHTRPRTKDRPSYDNATTALVTTVDRGRFTLLVPDVHAAGNEDVGAGRALTAMKSRTLGRTAVVVGDRVRVVGDRSGDEGSLARIVEVEERRTVLRRTSDDDDPVERVIVANAEQLVVVTSLADPPPRPRLIDRCLVAALDAGMGTLLCLTKVDLASPDVLLSAYRPLGVDAVAVTRGGDLEPLRARLRGRVSVLVGHSGVGKSTLVNALLPDARRHIGVVNAVTGRGRHTSTSAVALPLSEGGWIVDTPGIRSFGLAHVEPSRLIRAFPDLAAATSDCPRGCGHTAADPECALDLAVAREQVDPERVDPERVDSFRRLLSSREPARGDARGPDA